MMLSLVLLLMINAPAARATSAVPPSTADAASGSEYLADLLEFALPDGLDRAAMIAAARARVGAAAARVRQSEWYRSIPRGRPWSNAERRAFEKRVPAFAREIHAALRKIMLERALDPPTPGAVAAFTTLIDRVAAFAALLDAYPGNRGSQYLNGYALLTLPVTITGTLAALMLAGYAGGAAAQAWVPYVMAGSWATFGGLMHLVSRTAFGQSFIRHTVPNSSRAPGVDHLVGELLVHLERAFDTDPALGRLRERFADIESEAALREVLPFGPAATAGCARWLAVGEPASQPGAGESP